MNIIISIKTTCIQVLAGSSHVWGLPINHSDAPSHPKGFVQPLVLYESPQVFPIYIYI